MSVTEIKKTKSDLISWIEDLSDINMLNVLNELKNSQKNDWWDGLAEDQKKHLNEGLSDVEDGNIQTSAVFWDKLTNE